MRYVRWKALNCGVWPPTSEFVLSLPLIKSLPKVSATATAALKIKAAWTVPTLKPASGSSCGASSRSIFGRWQQCFAACAGLVICAAKIRLLADASRLCNYFEALPVEGFLALAMRL